MRLQSLPQLYPPSGQDQKERRTANSAASLLFAKLPVKATAELLTPKLDWPTAF